MSARSVAIIGGGFSGASLAMQLVAQRDAKLRVCLIERSGRFGTGLAYGTTQSAHLLNVRASRMSALPEAPNHFADWLRPRSKELDPGADFAPRAIYGEYLEGLVRDAAQKSKSALALVRDTAITCRPEKKSWSVGLASDDAIKADVVVLATGHAPSTIPGGLENVSPLLDPWDSEALLRIAPEDDVLLIGSGLTMIDVVLTLTSGPRTGVIHVLSRRGLLPRAHADSSPPPKPAPDLPPTLSDALHAVRREIKASGEGWQFMLDRLRAEAPALWRRLTPETQARFLRHLRPWWDAHRHRMAPHIGLCVDALCKTGLLSIDAGRIALARRDNSGIEIEYAPRGGGQTKRLRAAHVINCTGTSADVSQSREPVLRQMLDEGLIRSHPTKLGLDVDDECRVRHAKGVAAANLFALGPLTQGAFWEITAVPEIRTRAAALAKHIVTAKPARRPWPG